MGGGGLRLLPHKSWNVWNYDNREKVRRDEAKAQEEEELRRERSEAADQEARLEVLRVRARNKQPQYREIEEQHSIPQKALPSTLYDNDTSSYPALGSSATGASAAAAHHPYDGSDSEGEDAQYPALGGVGSSVFPGGGAGGGTHVNFFEDIENARHRRNGKNLSKQQERKQEEIRELKKIGALVFLGQTVTDAKFGPWYDEIPKSNQPDVKLSRRSASKRASADPMLAMKAHVKKKEQLVARDRRNAAESSSRHRSSSHLHEERDKREREARRQVQMLYRRPATPRDSAEMPGYSSQQQYRHFHNSDNGPRKRYRDGDVDEEYSGTSSGHKKKRKKDKKHKKDKKNKKDKY